MDDKYNIYTIYMGIQGFFNYFLNESDKQKQSKKFIIKETTDKSVSRLYVDFVNIIHDVLAENKHLDNGKDESDVLIIDKVLEKLKIIFSHYPNADKYIFFECIPTVAKIKEQYARRIFKKIQSDIEIDLKKKLKLEIDGKFDHQKFAIDSVFITLLSNKISSQFKHINIINFKNDKIGEAEHLIIQHIKNNKFIKGNKFVIYSPDADVFLLSTIMTIIMNIGFDEQQIVINAMRRSDDIQNRSYYKIDTNKYMDYLIKKVNGKKNKEQWKTIIDITYIFNLLGDDFIPVFDKFKVANSKEIFPIIFNSIKILNNQHILNYVKNKFVINKQNLLKIFEYINTISLDDYEIRPYKFMINVDKLNGENTMIHNKLVYDILIDGFQRGYYFYEKHTKSNKNNFYVTNKNYNKPYNSVDNKFFIVKNQQKDQFIIKINNSIYNSISLIEIDKHHPNIQNTDDMIKNYFEGYEFILDLYYNSCGTVENNFWYYKYETSPRINKIIKWLKNNNISSYIHTHKIPYFNTYQYKTYLSSLIDTNYSKLLSKSHIEYDDLITIGNKIKSNIFNCFEKKYINKCEIKREIFIDPIDFINNNMTGGGLYYKKYLKYIKKCQLLL